MMDTIAGFSDSCDISSTTFFASLEPTQSSIVYPAELLTGPDVSALQLLSNGLESVFESPETFYSDAKLVLDDGREVSFHRCILSARIPVFKSALAAAEKEKTSTTVKLVLKEIATDFEVSFDSVVAVLAYAYSGRVRPPPKGVSECADENCRHVACRPAVDFMVEVLYLAFVFQIPELVTLYERHLLDVVDKVIIEDTLVILKLANICVKTCKKLLDKCREIIVNSDIDLVSLQKSLPQHIVKQITDRRKELGFDASELKKHVLKIHKALDTDDVELVKMLLTDDHNSTLDEAYALHYAVAYCDVKTTTDLLDLELADVNHRNQRGYTVLHIAAMRKEPRLIVSLLTKGASLSETSLEGRTALLIAKQVTKAAEYYHIPEQGKPSLKGRLCVEILEQTDNRDPFPADVSSSPTVAAEELKMRLLDLENRVGLARIVFPMEAQVAMDIAQVKGTCEFIVSSQSDRLNGAKRTATELKNTPFKILEKHLIRLKALSKTVLLGKCYFPRCSAVLDQIMDCWDLSRLACVEKDTPEKRLQKKQRYMEIQDAVMKAFSEDKEELGKSASVPASSSSTSKSPATKRSNGKLSQQRRR